MITGADHPVPGSKIVLRAPLQGTVVGTPAAVGDTVAIGSPVVILESMKMEHVVGAPARGTVVSLDVDQGAPVAAGTPLAVIEIALVAGSPAETRTDPDFEVIRPELAELLDRQAQVLDSGRPEVVARRHAQGRRTARENIADLCDPDSFTEYGSLAIAAQRGRRPEAELQSRTPADGLVAGVGRINGDRFEDRRSSCAVLSYDYTVLAGTQGQQNHRKKDRLFELIERMRLPVVLFAEGGGGRPGDTDYAVITGLDTTAFARFGALSGLVPMVGVASGWCFAGNAALLGCCDVIIATTGASIGMGGPAMIEGGGLGTYRPEEVGPLEVQTANGVVDLVAEDDAGAVRSARQYLSYFQGADEEWSCADQRLLRTCVPENRLRVYDISRGDRGPGRHRFGAGAPGRIRARGGHGPDQGRGPSARRGGQQPGPSRRGHRPGTGRTRRPGSSSSATPTRSRSCSCATPPGSWWDPMRSRPPRSDTSAGCSCSGPASPSPTSPSSCAKGTGSAPRPWPGGASARRSSWWPGRRANWVGWGSREPFASASAVSSMQWWIRTNVRALFQDMVDRAYRHGRALNVATAFEIDDVIDPADSRRRIVEALRAAPPPAARSGKKRSCIDTW